MVDELALYTYPRSTEPMPTIADCRLSQLYAVRVLIDGRQYVVL